MAKLLIISGPSGAGKGTICAELIKTGDYAFSVSMTTRAPRTGETDGKDYFFVSQEKFDQTIKEDGFLEYVHKFQRSYGTPKQPVLDMLNSGKNVLLDIEMEGSLNVKKIFPEAVSIFVLPPNLNSLLERLRGRGTETEEQIAFRTKEIQEEIAFLSKYDYYVVNDDLNKAVENVKSIVAGQGESHRIVDAQALIEKYKEEK